MPRFKSKVKVKSNANFEIREHAQQTFADATSYNLRNSSAAGVEQRRKLSSCYGMIFVCGGREKELGHDALFVKELESEEDNVNWPICETSESFHLAQKNHTSSGSMAKIFIARCRDDSNAPTAAMHACWTGLSQEYRHLLVGLKSTDLIETRPVPSDKPT